jgi:hypothetical protein
MYRVGGTKAGPERTMLQLQEPKKEENEENEENEEKRRTHHNPPSRT